MSKEDAAKLSASDRGVKVTFNRKYYLIPQYRAYSLDEFRQRVNKLRRFETPGHVEYFFRGQTRDYLDGSGSLRCHPAGLRTGKWQRRYSGLGQVTFERELASWDKILVGEYRLDVKSQLGFTQRTEGFLSYYMDRSPKARVLTNIMLVSILQHYGFPTPHLDVTTDPLIALWFALHACVEVAPRKWHYQGLQQPPPLPKNGSPQELFEIPSVLLFVEDPSQYAVNVLTSVDALRGVADRPFRQNAFLLPFDELSVAPVNLPLTAVERERIGSRQGVASRLSSRILVGRTYRSTDRLPFAVIKLYFSAEELRAVRPELTAEYLFPSAEQLYARLRSKRVPHLAVYV